MSVPELFVCVKQSVSIIRPLALAAGNRMLAPECRRLVVNGADGFALEQALRLREQGLVERITCLTVGPAEAGSVPIWCLGMGADRALRIDVPDAAGLDQFGVGMVLGVAIRRLGGRLVLAAQRSDDGGSGIVPAAIARTLGAAYLSNAVNIKVVGDCIEIERKIEHGNRQVWASALPVVVGIERGGCVPRYMAVAKLLRAKRRPPEEMTLPALGLNMDALPRLTAVQRLTPPRLRPKKTAFATSGQSVVDSMKMMVSGGMAEKKEKKILKGTPAQLIAGVVKLLRERQILR